MSLTETIHERLAPFPSGLLFITDWAESLQATEAAVSAAFQQMAESGVLRRRDYFEHDCGAHLANVERTPRQALIGRPCEVCGDGVEPDTVSVVEMYVYMGRRGVEALATSPAQAWRRRGRSAA